MLNRTWGDGINFQLVGCLLRMASEAYCKILIITNSNFGLIESQAAISVQF